MCVDGLGCVYVCESYVVLDQCDEPPSRVCSPSVRMVVQWGILCVLAFCVSFVPCIVMMSVWVLCTYRGTRRWRRCVWLWWPSTGGTDPVIGSTTIHNVSKT